MKTINDLLIEFDEMGFAPTTPCPDPEKYATEWREKVRAEFERAESENTALLLWTCREGESLREAVGMCREVGLVFDYVNQNDAYLKKQFGNDCRKVGADIYLDDKAMRIEDIPLFDEEMATLSFKVDKTREIRGE